jgi:hypothetical protein
MQGMSAVSTDELVVLSRRVAREIDARLNVSGVLAAEGGTGRAELLISIEGCHADPCSIVLNVDRSDPMSAERDLSEKLRKAITDHLSIA